MPAKTACHLIFQSMFVHSFPSFMWVYVIIYFNFKLKLKESQLWFGHCQLYKACYEGKKKKLYTSVNFYGIPGALNNNQLIMVL